MCIIFVPNKTIMKAPKIEKFHYPDGNRNDYDHRAVKVDCGGISTQVTFMETNGVTDYFEFQIDTPELEGFRIQLDPRKGLKFIIDHPDGMHDGYTPRSWDEWFDLTNLEYAVSKFKQYLK